MAPKSNFHTCVWCAILNVFLTITDHQKAFAFNVTNPYQLTKEQIGLISLYKNELTEKDLDLSENNKINLPICGLTNSPKIVGGSETGLHEFPWMAFILTNITKNIYLCGGSLITKRHVLTAAHCLENAHPAGVTVFLGGHNIFNLTNSGAIILKADGFKIHPGYTTKANLSGFDIAIITLNHSVKFNSRILPICLPTPNLFCNYEGRTATVIGWGRRGSGTGLSSVLLKVNVPIISHAICEAVYAKISVKITPKMLCAGSKGKDVCMGDSGGPLMLMKEGRYYVVGIVSFGDASNCGSSGRTGVYTKVESFLKFIHETIANS